MKRNRVIALVVVVAAVAVAAWGLLFGPSAQERRVVDAVTTYDLALAESLRILDPAPLTGLVEPREYQRVTNYITLLWGRGVSLESTLLEVEVLELESTEVTITALVRERWTYTERDRESDQVVSGPTEETQTLRYTLFDREGTLLVGLSELTEESP